MDKDQLRNEIHSLPPKEDDELTKMTNFLYPSKTPELPKEIADSVKCDFPISSDEFDKLINERKVERSEKAKEARQADRGRIADRNSRTGIHPVELFPREIWIMLLKLMTPVERLHLYNLHQWFGELLEDTLIHDVLFPVVIGVGIIPVWNPEEHEEDDPLNYVTVKSATLRLISKGMRDVVDGWYERNCIHVLEKCEMRHEPINGFRINLEKLVDCKKVVEIITRLQSSTSHLKVRFFTRALKIISPTRGEYSQDSSPEERNLFEDMENKMNQMLDLIGDQIWFFCFEFAHPSHFRRDLSTVKELPNRYSSVLQWLGKMPNLKWIKMRIIPVFMTHDVSAENVWYHDHSQPAAPTLLQLERLDLELKNKRDGAIAIFNHLLRSYPQVKRLNLSGLNTLFKDEGNPLNPTLITSPDSMLRITALGIIDRELCPYSGIESEEESDDADTDIIPTSEDEVTYLFHAIVSNEWSLKRLQLHMKVDKVNLDLVFHMIGAIRTIEDLSLTLEDPMIEDEINNIDLPKLSRLTLAVKSTKSDLISDFPNKFFSLEFLNLTKELNDLNVTLDMTMENWQKVSNGSPTITCPCKRLDFEKLLLTVMDLSEGEPTTEKNCNIWQVFANLNEIELKLFMRNNEGTNLQKSVWKVYKRCELS